MRPYKIISFCLALYFFLSINQVYAKQKITVAYAEMLAPWVIADGDEGIIVEIFEAAMTPLGYEIEHVYLPYARRTKAFESGLVDVVSDMNENTIETHGLQGYFSDIAYSYENFAFSLSKNKFNFTELSDLEHHSLLSWQDAAVHLGDEYAQMVNNNKRYGETYDQSNQVKMLFLERYEVVQMDAQIFNYYRKKLAESENLDVTPKVDRFALFGASPNGFLFKSEKIRDEFNTQLKWLKDAGKYKKIFARYAGSAEKEATN